MENKSLTLDDFLSRFQLLRPQINRESLNLRQAAVLIPVVRRPSGAAVDPAFGAFTQTRRAGGLPRRRG